MFRNTELRKLPAGSLLRICETLETNDDWKKVMSKIPKNLNSEKFEPKYNDPQMRAIAEYAKQANRYCAEILFDEWGTSGRVRPTLGTLQEVVKKAGVLKAADEIALLLQEPPVSRPDHGPGARVNTRITEILIESDASNRGRSKKTESTARMKSDVIPSFFKRLKNSSIGNKTTQQVLSDEREHYGEYNSESNYSNDGMPNFPRISKLIRRSEHTNSQRNMLYPRQPVKIDTTILQNKTLIVFDYNELKDITSGFSEEFIHGPTGPTGKIGSGGFGDVYAGWHKQHGTLAVKRFKRLAEPYFVQKTFNTEVKFLAQLRHENIVPIVGYSIQKNGNEFPTLCMVCEYVDGGALDTNLANGKLDERQRLEIIVGTARGLEYIHKTVISSTDLKNTDPELNRLPSIHGDVKTANILLTRDYKPKLCDFGLTKSFTTTKITNSLISGTQPYMSIEKLQGTITQKSDIYSFGVVLLEVLTGLPCSITRKNGNKTNIQHYITEKTRGSDVTELFDENAKPWTKGLDVYELAKQCLKDDYESRYSIDQVCEELANITADLNNGSLENVETVEQM